MSARPLATALLLAPSPHASIASSLAFWTASVTSALARPRVLPTLLYIGAPPPFATVPRRSSFARAQRMLTGLYSLVHRLLSAAPTAALPIDVRIVLLATDDDAADAAAFGPVVTVDQLADTREWDVLLVPRGEAGYQLQGAFLAATASPGVRVYYVDAGVPAATETEDTELAAASEGDEHSVVAVGGTFDHLHLGHKLLLTMTAYLLTSPATSTGDPRLLVGLSGPALLRSKKHAEFMESWEIRSTRALEFLRGVVDATPFESRAAEDSRRDEGGDSDGDGVRKVVSEIPEFREERAEDGTRPGRSLLIEIVSISDLFGPTITDPSITALVVTQETASGGAAVNEKRAEASWPALDVAVVDLLISHDGEKLSSTELRRQKAA